MKKLLSFLNLYGKYETTLIFRRLPLYVMVLMVALGYVFSSCGNPQKEKAGQTTLSPNCSYSRDETDKNGNKVRVVAEEKFIAFQFSDSALQKLYKGADFVKGYMRCVSVDTVMGIYIDFTIHTEEAYQYYGSIKKGNKITFILKSGKTVELLFGSTFSGNTNLSNESTEYSSFAHISRAAAHELQSEELQRVVISWSKMDEEYAVINPEIFINQLPCIE